VRPTPFADDPLGYSAAAVEEVPMRGDAPISVVRTSAVTRLVWGATLLSAPGLVLRLLGGRQTRLAHTILRVLGARHVVQATVTAVRPNRVVLMGGAGLDGLHALSALALAAVDPSQVRIGLTDAGMAATWIGLDLGAMRRSARRAPPWPSAVGSAAIGWPRPSPSAARRTAKDGMNG
jgi:hypothetical protein